jgi:hypothetical protein
LTTKSNLKDYMDGYKTTLRATRSAVVPAGRINPIDTNPATNADLRKCMQAFDDALIMRKFDSENHIYKNLHGYKWKTSVAGQARQFPMSIEGKPPVPLPDGQGQLEEIDWQRSAQTMNLPHALLGRWRRFHSDLAAGNMDQINKGNSDPNGLAILDTPDPKTGRTYLEGFKSHTRAIGYMQSLIQDIPQAC